MIASSWCRRERGPVEEAEEEAAVRAAPPRAQQAALPPVVGEEVVVLVSPDEVDEAAARSGWSLPKIQHRYVDGASHPTIEPPERGEARARATR